MRRRPAPSIHALTREPLLLLLALVAVVTVPILLRRDRGPLWTGASESLVIITPNYEAIRSEFGRAFEEHWLRKTGRRVRVDWRSPGGTSEIARYLESQYLSSFQHYWRDTLRRPWSGAIARAFADPKVTLPADRAAETPEQQARRAFLEAPVSCGIDLFFGGGAFDFIQQAAVGRLVPSGVVREHPELFNPQVIPQTFAGEQLWDPQGRWVGVCLDAFGICSNRDALRRLGIPAPPRRWEDLADPRLRHQLGMANPTQSGSVNKALEMLVQQQIGEAITARRGADPAARLSPDDEAAALREGWTRAMRLLMRLGANARYFSDASSKIALDVAAGEAAAGTTIGLYGRFQSEALREADGSSRLFYANAQGGTSFGADPVGLLRGAPHPELAREFIRWLLTPEAQKLWNWKVGAPGGPRRYALRRLPILPSLYAEEYRPLRSDPDENPYSGAETLTYHPEWTSALFRPIAFIVRVMCIEPHAELTRAWEALLAAGLPPEATAIFSEVSAVDYDAAQGPIRAALRGRKIDEVEMARALSERFRAQYRRAEILARAGN